MALYSAAAAVLAGLERGEGGLKSLVYNSGFPVRPEGTGVRGGRGSRSREGGGSQEPGAGPVALIAGCSAACPAAVRAGVRDPPLRLGAGEAAGWSRAAAGREEAAAAAGEGTAVRGIPGPWDHFLQPRCPSSQNPLVAVSRSRGGLGRRGQAHLVPSPQVLVYDLLFGKGLKCGGRWKALARRHRARLEAELARMKVRHKVSRNEDLLAPEKAVSTESEWARAGWAPCVGSSGICV